MLGQIDDTNRRRAEAMLDVQDRSSGVDSVLQTALGGIRSAFDTAIEDLGGNTTVLAAQRGVEAAQVARRQEAIQEAARRYANPQGAGVDFLNQGIFNNYGAFSPGARAKPARPSGVSGQERAQR